jgi:hypothetical protein
MCPWTGSLKHLRQVKNRLPYTSAEEHIKGFTKIHFNYIPIPAAAHIQTLPAQKCLHHQKKTHLRENKTVSSGQYALICVLAGAYCRGRFFRDAKKRNRQSP